MLGKTCEDQAAIFTQVLEEFFKEVESDGLLFDPTSLQTERITEDTDYEGVRIRFRGSLDTARVIVQIDIGFGDIVYPEVEVFEFPTILDHPSPRLWCYSRESSIAEKFEAMLKLGELNSRMICTFP